MRQFFKPRQVMIPALALGYALFLVWWLNRDEGQTPPMKDDGRTTKQFSSKAAPALLQEGAGRSNSSRENAAESAAVTDRRYSGKAGEVARAKPVLSNEMSRFKPVLYTEGQPHYAGEPVAAYVRVGSTGQEAALTVNQNGEYPQLLTEPGEEVQIRLAFTRTEPGEPVALTAQDGGLVVLAEGGMASPPKANKGEQDARPTLAARSTAGVLDAQRQIGFAFRVSPNPGIHRVTVGSPSGETKVLEFWAGPPPKLKEMTREIEAIGK